MKITIVRGPAKKRPRLGDIRTVRGVKQIRVFKMARDARGNVIGYDCTGGRQRYEWRATDER